MGDAGTTSRPPRVTVIGLGNPLMGDDGLGVRAAERLQERYRLPETVEVVDGGTWGMRLLPAIEDAASLILLDAIDVGMPLGAVVELARADIPRTLSHKLSPHQVDVADVLALCELRGRLPMLMVALGLQPGHIALGAPLSAAVGARLDALVATTAWWLGCWGHPCVERTGVRLPEGSWHPPRQADERRQPPT
jgi:hydrogenase maturation protease